MTADEFRAMALSLDGTVEGAHGGHPDFRVGGKIFASLGAPDANWGMAKLPPEEQRRFLAAAPETFVPCSGAWGTRGYTNIRLATADAEMTRAALEIAFESIASRSPKSTGTRRKTDRK